MKRIAPLCPAIVLVALSSAGAQTPAELAQTASYVAAFQTDGGGFAPNVGGGPSLGSASSAIRSLKYSGGSIKDVLGCIDYVKRCRDAQTGGFAQSPGGKVDVPTTASGLMAIAELRIIDADTVTRAVEYLAANARTFEEIRIAVAGLEAVKATSPAFAAWTGQVEADRNSAGTWGQGAGQARATGSAAVALLRMGVNLDRKDAVVTALRSGQRGDGGWSDGDKPSDLGSSYRIMRCFYMLGEKPDIDRLLAYVARHRQTDGGYGPAPGKPSDLGSTYFALIMIRWARQLRGEPPLVETAGFQPLSGGSDLARWEGDHTLWSARDGMIVGKSSGLNHNDFLATEASYGDFILKFSFRLIGDENSNSGVQFRSVRVPGHEMSGYQADIGQSYWGALYDESRRNKVLVPASEKALAAVRKDGWNHYVVRAMGDRITLTLNGVMSVDFREPDAAIAREGKIALQIHGGGPMEIQFKDVYVQSLPTPAANDDATPGWHLRTLKTSSGERKYTLFLPRGYDGSKAFPVVLFLHGAGERGDDGVRSAQVGLGAIINGRPDDFPVIGVFPQARKTWAADSEDAAAALAALDEVMTCFKTKPDQVILTGLSMGGAGSWQLGAAHPERFSAIVPVCGFSRPDTATALKDRPIWTFAGDDDSAKIVGQTRALIVALREAGARPRFTEYRGVGHNSWDRAYSDPSLVAWMLAQSRQPKP
jgi:poly(3-hydroxybutyrate) depolymerase/prenyltransferase beta subunit